MDTTTGTRTVKAMWWIKARLKRILVVLLLIAGIGGALAVTSKGDGKPGSDGGTGVRVYQDDQGRIVVKNSNNLRPALSFPLPRDCAESLALMKGVRDEHTNTTKATPEARQVFALYDGLAKELCSYVKYQAASADFIQKWFSGGVPAASTTTVPGAASTAAPESAPATSQDPNTTTTEAGTRP